MTTTRRLNKIPIFFFVADGTEGASKRHDTPDSINRIAVTGFIATNPGRGLFKNSMLNCHPASTSRAISTTTQER
jgi:hypothetical protein